jgi:hypothetical protein
MSKVTSSNHLSWERVPNEQVRACRLRGDLIMDGLVLHLPDCKEETSDIESKNCPDALDREDRGDDHTPFDRGDVGALGVQRSGQLSLSEAVLETEHPDAEANVFRVGGWERRRFEDLSASTAKAILCGKL